jgi:hypothetical protein
VTVVGVDVANFSFFLIRLPVALALERLPDNAASFGAVVLPLSAMLQAYELIKTD